MSTEETTTVGKIEAQAENLLENANRKSEEILIKARVEVSKILSSELPMDEIKLECERIINRAKEEADEKIADSRKKASEIRGNADRKVEKIVEHIASIITGD